MVTLLQNVRALFGPFVLSDQPVIHTCSLADTQPANCFSTAPLAQLPLTELCVSLKIAHNI